MKPSLKESANLSNILHSTINFSSSYNKSFSIFLTCDSVTGENSKSDTFAFSLIFYDAWVFLINWCATINTNTLCYVDIEGVRSLTDLCLVCDELFILLQNYVKSQEVSPFTAGDQKAHINRRIQRHSHTTCIYKH